MMKPKIRFNGFTDDWEQRKLGELTIYRNGTGHEEKQSESGKYELINLNSISIDGGLKPSGKFIDEETETLLKDDLVMVLSDVGHGDLLGRVAIIPENNRFVLNQRVALLRNNSSVDIKYLFSYINAHQIYFKKQGAGSSQLNISRGSVENFEVLLPHKDEQKKIGKYLSSIDNLITLHQRKCDGLKKLKKYMLQNMFPQNGEKTPKIRFQGFINAWEQRKLEEIYQNIGNAFVGTATPYYVDTGHFYLESNNIKDGQINRNNEVFINDEFYERQKDKWLHTGDMVMVQSGHVGHTAVIPEELDNSAAHALIMFRNPKIEIEPYFLNYQYQTIKSKRKINNITTGNTIKHILASDMYNFIVDVSDIEEQQQIANYFLELDHLITLHQRKVEQMKNLKKYMLQNMFPAEK
ncbi:restriction endonuclease subunit S [Amedibacterium intestinale]|uniref:Restriction endonuclease subunit S n=3 Tax=Amedibacterium intestinale TaxID=2583452 RepID=A0A6N4TKT6_9FIRM|nr:restriction endonuclease subunit S [Amedibacterium intestinale]BBK23347.1 restriction endonuclease subunit S [Amedibacterium intestinale]